MSNFNHFLQEIERLDDEVRDLRAKAHRTSMEKKDVLGRALSDDDFLRTAIQMNAVTLNMRALRKGHSTKSMPKVHTK